MTKAMIDSPTTMRRRAFCRYIAEGMNTKEAALAAGYSESFANTKAYPLRETPECKKMIDELTRKVDHLVALDAAAVLNGLGAIAFTSPADLLVQDVTDGVKVMRWKRPDELTPEQRAAIRSVRVSPVYQNEKDGSGQNVKRLIGQEYSYQFNDRMKALDALAKHFKLYEPDDSGGVRFPDFSNMPHSKLTKIMHLIEEMQKEEEAINGEVLPDDRRH